MTRRTCVTPAAAMLAALLLITATSETQAQLIAADSYENGGTDYNAGFGNSFNGQDSTSAIGFSGAWGGGSSSGNTHPDTGTLSNPAIDYESGGKGKFTASTAFSDFERRFEHNLAPFAAPANDVFYMSHLVNTGGEAQGGDTEGYAMVGFGSFADKGRLEGTANFLFGAFVGYAPDGAGDVDLVIRSRTGAGSVSDAILQDASAGDVVDNTTFHVVMKLTYTGGDMVEWWLNPTDLSSDAAMSSNSLASGTIPGFQLGSAADMNHLTVNTFGYDRSFFFDESRLGYDLNSVTGIPEPASIALLGLALGLIGANRSRRQS